MHTMNSGFVAPAISLACTFFSVTAFSAPAPQQIRLVPIGTYESGIFDEGAAEIVAHDPASQRLYVVNAKAAALDVLSISDPANPTKVGETSLLPFGGVANSVAVREGLVAVAVESVPKTMPGRVVFFDTDLNFINSAQVGALPDMVTFSPNGRWVLAANEGEPNSYNDEDAEEVGPSVDPEGSVSIIDLSAGAAALTQANVRTASFTAFNGAALPAGLLPWLV